jgi:Tol biopolymer transport system component
VRPFLATRDWNETWPYWSEAGRRLVYQAEPRAGGAAELLVWQPGQRQPQPLAQRPARDARWAEWSPDGSRIVFAFREGGAASGIAAIDVASGREELLAASGPRDFLFRPSYAPDGRRVVAQRHAPGVEGSTLWLVAPGEPPRRLTLDTGWFEQKPFFTRDGAWVVFARARGQAPRELALVDAQGRIVPLEAGRAGADEHSARPSPTRDEIAFVSDRDGSRDVFLAPLSGGPARNLTRTRDRDEFAPRWSPDGERLVVTRVPPQAPGRAGDKLDPAQTQLVVIDRSGRVLFETQGMMADWMPPF